MPRRALSSMPAPADAEVFDIARHVPAILNEISGRLSRGASRQCRATFDVGMGVWRCLSLLVVEGRISARRVSQVAGMDLAMVVRCFEAMQVRGMIMVRMDEPDGRQALASLTRKGRAMHDDIRDLALERERVLLSVLSADERETLGDLLRRLRDNLPEVDAATTRYLEDCYPGLPGRASAGTRRGNDRQVPA